MRRHFAGLLIVVVSGAGCGGSGEAPRTEVTANNTAAPQGTIESTPGAAAFQTPGSNGGGIGLASDCAKVDAWAATEKDVAGVEAAGAKTFTESRVKVGARYVILRVEDTHVSKSYPKSVQASAALRPGACDLCVTLGEQCATDFESCKAYYFAQSGQVTVSEAGADAGSGAMRASLSALKLVQWDKTQNVPRAGGACIAIEAADLGGSW